MGRPQQLSGIARVGVWRNRRELKAARDVGFDRLIRNVISSLVQESSFNDPKEGTPHYEALAFHAWEDAPLLATQRRGIIKREIGPLKKILGIPPYEPRQHKKVLKDVEKFARTHGLPVERAVELASEQMQQAVALQQEKSKKKISPIKKKVRRVSPGLSPRSESVAG